LIVSDRFSVVKKFVARLRETNKVKRAVHFLSARFAALHPRKPNRACWEQLRAGLRRKEGSPSALYSTLRSPWRDGDRLESRLASGSKESSDIMGAELDVG